MPNNYKTLTNLEGYENIFMKKIYKRIIILALMVHFGYAVTFLFFNIKELFIFNSCSTLYYTFLLILTKNGNYKVMLLLTHIEVGLFASYTTILVGWECGFALFYICMASLVYFCPYKNRYIPYLFSLFELALFIITKIFTLNIEPIYANVLVDYSIYLYFINTLGCFFVILYAAFISNISARATQKELISANDNLIYLANHDYLTGLMTRRGAFPILNDLYIDYLHHNRPFTLIMSDIDNFKSINDNYGHACGDYVLRIISELFSGFVNEKNISAVRWGGEEFLIVYKNSSKEECIEEIVKLCEAVALFPFEYDKYSFNLTMTFGMCDCTSSDSVQDMIATADGLLYQGKRNGKNQVL